MRESIILELNSPLDLFSQWDPPQIELGIFSRVVCKIPGKLNKEA
jgi:hypothetical protein